MRIFVTALFATFLATAFSLGALSQDKPAEQSADTPATMEKQPAAEETTMEKKPAAEEKSMASEPAEEKDSMVISADEMKKWVGLPVYSSSGNEIGKVTKLLTESDGTLRELHIEFGGIFGFFASTYIVNPDQFEKQEDKIALKLTEEEAKKLPQPKS